MAYLDRGVSEAYVSPEIEAALGYSREEWLEDPVRWYDRIHPDDKQRWSLEAAEHVSLRQAAALLLPGDRARRPSRLVPLRCPHGAPARWTALVHPRRGLRHLRLEALRASPSTGAQCCLGNSRHGRRARNRPRSRKAASSDSTALANSPPAIPSTKSAARHIWDFFLLPEEVERSTVDHHRS